jgi:hypothetical protein
LFHINRVFAHQQRRQALDGRAADGSTAAQANTGNAFVRLDFDERQSRVGVRM